METHSPLLRRPTKTEQYEAKIDTSDYQISSITIQSSILSTLKMVSRVYRSKCVVTKHSNIAAMRRYQKIFSKFFSYFTPKTKMSEIAEVLQYGGTNINGMLDFPMMVVLKDFENWKAVFKENRLRDSITSQILKENGKVSVSELPQESVARIEDIHSKAYPMLKEASEKGGLTLRRFLTRAVAIDSYISTLFFTDVFEPFVQKSTKDDETVASFQKRLNAYTEKELSHSKKEYTQKVIDAEAVEKQRHIAQWLNEHNIPGGLSLPNVVKFWLSEEPSVVDDCRFVYNVDLTDGSFKSWEELATYLYSPEMLSSIRADLNVKVRARSTGSARKGLMTSYATFNKDKALENLRKMVKDYDPKTANSRVKKAHTNLTKWTKESERAKKAREHAKHAYEEALNSGAERKTITRLKKQWVELRSAAAQVSKNMFAAKRAYEKATKDKDRKDDALSKIDEYERRNKELMEDVKRKVDNEEFNLGSTVSVRQSTEQEETIPYYTWSFRIRSMNEAVVKHITDQLEEGFCKSSDGKPNYVNVTPHVFLDENRCGVTVFAIDYPKSSKLYKLFSKKPQFSNELIESLCNDTYKATGHVVVVEEEETIINEPFEQTLGDGLMQMLTGL